MDFLYNIQFFAWFGIVGWLVYLGVIQGQSWDDLIEKRVSSCLALMYLIIGSFVSQALNPIFSSITTRVPANGQNSPFEYVVDSQGFEWAGGGFVLISNIISLIIASIITAYIHSSERQE